ncbi:ATP-binding protein [Candidatus Bathyarchaeota archaeon]|nr:MAG: ATP-binding protein [Candidatus Bathyarchaeota archaeon]
MLLEEPSEKNQKGKKVYINDPGVRNVAVGALNEYLLGDTAELGKVIEAVVADHCRRLKFALEPTSEIQTFYWKNKQYETDIIIEMFQKPLPIEVKYRERIDKRDLRGLLEFSERNKPSIKIVVTRERLDQNDEIIFIPLRLFLMMC